MGRMLYHMMGLFFVPRQRTSPLLVALLIPSLPVDGPVEVLGDNNEPPLARADSFVVYKDSPDNLLRVLSDNGNGPDVDPDGDPLLITQVGLPDQGGTALISSSGTEVLYLPAMGFEGVETFPYILSDGEFSVPSTVKVRVLSIIFEDTFDLDPVLTGSTGRTGSETPWIGSNPSAPNAAGSITGNGRGQVELTKVNGRGFAHLAITREISTAGFKDITFDLAAFQSATQFEVTDFLTFEIDTGSGFIELIRDVGVWEATTTPSQGTGPGQKTSLATGPVSLPPAASDNPSLKIKISASLNVTDIETYSFDAFRLAGDQQEPPEAMDDNFSVDQDSSAHVLSVLLDHGMGPDRDPDGDPIYVAHVSAPNKGGTASLLDNETPADPTDDRLILYSPRPGFHGEEVFTYTIQDGSLSSTGTVFVQVREHIPTLRTKEHLLVLYDFFEGEGTNIFDVSGVHPPVDLVAGEASSIAWEQNGGLRISTPTLIRSERAATKIYAAVTNSQALTLEAWVIPANVTQSGPARMVTISKDTALRNMTLGQRTDTYEFRLRTTQNDENGTRPSVSFPPASVTTSLTHVAIARDSNGVVSLYLDGELEAEASVSGSFANWDTTYELGVANELSGGTPWLGRFLLMAMYSKALTASEVAQNFSAGPPRTNTNRSPRARDDRFLIIAESASNPLALLNDNGEGEDFDPEGQPLSVVAAGPPNQGGTVVLQTASNLVFYSPAAGFSGTETFTYTISDGALSTTAHVHVDVKAVVEAMFTEAPRPFQCYPRDLERNSATVPVKGDIRTKGFQRAVLKVYRNDVLHNELSTLLSYHEGHAPFDFTVEISAELAPYDLKLYVVTGSSEVLVQQFQEIVAGDIYLINGQSNAVAEKRGEQGANFNQSPFLRSFGTSSTNENETIMDLEWHPAEGDSKFSSGAVGQWGLRMGRLLVDTHRIPIAIINAAHGGQKLSFFLRNEAQPTDLTTNYGKALFRTTEAGVSHAVRAIFWHQGERDDRLGTTVDTYISQFEALYRAWVEDFAGLEHVYVHQIREGCGSTNPALDVKEAQRIIPDLLPFSNVSVVSTTGIDGHQLDQCHFDYTHGYELIASHLADLVSRDIYGLMNEKAIDPPNIDFAFLSNAQTNEIVLVMRDARTELIWQPGAHEDFELLGTTGAHVIDGRAAQGIVRLSFLGDGEHVHAVRYKGHEGAGRWITNTNGVGLLAFDEVAISSAVREETISEISTDGSARFQVDWKTIPGEHYLIEYTENLVETEWVLHEGIQATNILMQIEDDRRSPKNRSRCYRVRWSP